MDGAQNSVSKGFSIDLGEDGVDLGRSKTRSSSCKQHTRES
jgi:hypothetical protein